MPKRNFGKDYKTPRELVTLLENRGLIINDRQKAQLYLESIGYYRLSAYMQGQRNNLRDFIFKHII